MADIEIEWVQERTTYLDDFGLRPGSTYYLLRYPMPGVQDMQDHVHGVPMDAIANYMIDTGDTSALRGLEFCVLDRVDATLADTPEISPEQPALLSTNKELRINVHERSRSLAQVRESLSEAVIETAKVVPITDQDSMVSEVMGTVTRFPYAQQRLRSNSVAMRKVEQITDARQIVVDQAWQSLSAHTIVESAGWNTAQTMFMNNRSKVESHRNAMFKERFGSLIGPILDERIRKGT